MFFLGGSASIFLAGRSVMALVRNCFVEVSVLLVTLNSWVVYAWNLVQILLLCPINVRKV